MLIITYMNFYFFNVYFCYYNCIILLGIIFCLNINYLIFCIFISFLQQTLFFIFFGNFFCAYFFHFYLRKRSGEIVSQQAHALKIVGASPTFAIFLLYFVKLYKKDLFVLINIQKMPPQYNGKNKSLRTIRSEFESQWGYLSKFNLIFFIILCFWTYIMLIRFVLIMLEITKSSYQVNFFIVNRNFNLKKMRACILNFWFVMGQLRQYYLQQMYSVFLQIFISTCFLTLFLLEICIYYFTWIVGIFIICIM